MVHTPWIRIRQSLTEGQGGRRGPAVSNTQQPSQGQEGLNLHTHVARGGSDLSHRLRGRRLPHRDHRDREGALPVDRDLPGHLGLRGLALQRRRLPAAWPRRGDGPQGPNGVRRGLREATGLQDSPWAVLPLVRRRCLPAPLGLAAHQPAGRAPREGDRLTNLTSDAPAPCTPSRSTGAGHSKIIQLTVDSEFLYTQ